MLIRNENNRDALAALLLLRAMLLTPVTMCGFPDLEYARTWEQDFLSRYHGLFGPDPMVVCVQPGHLGRFEERELEQGEFERTESQLFETQEGRCRCRRVGEDELGQVLQADAESAFPGIPRFERGDHAG